MRNQEQDGNGRIHNTTNCAYYHLTLFTKKMWSNEGRAKSIHHVPKRRMMISRDCLEKA